MVIKKHVSTDEDCSSMPCLFSMAPGKPGKGSDVRPAVNKMESVSGVPRDDPESQTLNSYPKYQLAGSPKDLC